MNPTHFFRIVANPLSLATRNLRTSQLQCVRHQRSLWNSRRSTPVLLDEQPNTPDPEEAAVSTRKETRRGRKRRTARPQPLVNPEEETRRREKQVEIARANTLFRPAGRFLEAKEPGAALKACHDALSQLKDSRNIAYRMYENAIAVFLRESHFVEACQLYVRMVKQDGFMPSILLRAQMDAISIAAEIEMGGEGKDKPEAQGLLETLQPTLEDPLFDEQCLLQLVRFLGRQMNTNPDVLKEIIETHTDARGPDALTHDAVFVELIFLERRRDAINRALWESGMREEIGKILGHHFETSQYAGEAASPAPYNAALRELPAEALDSYSDVLRWMTEAGVEPNLDTYSALIDIQERRGRYDKVFALYRLLRSKALEDPSIIPDARIFRALFFARSKCGGNTTGRHPAQRKGKAPLDPDVIPSPRALFRDMLSAHLHLTGGQPTTPSRALNTRALHTALRDLVAAGDDAGAFVAVRTFTSCNIAPNFHAYQAVVMGLVTRILRIWNARTRNPSEEAWLDALLAPVVQEIEDAAGHPLPPTLAKVLLRLSREPALRGDALPPTIEELYPLDVASEVWATSDRGFVPSVDMLVGAEPAPVVSKWDVVPLERVLRRVIAAALPSGLDGERPSAAAVGAVIVQAKEDMVPRAQQRPVQGAPVEAKWPTQHPKMPTIRASSSRKLF